MKALASNETELVGSWTVKDNRILKDDVTDRIEWLIMHSLRQIGTDASGWDTLFRDPADGRLWELIYPQSETHGGGPPLLRNISPEIACDKYNWT
jgi:hypothetical protein